ncbi:MULTISPECIES: ferritin family protein [Virgibacillus]|uniref:Ferritin family protein n=1 Tax=Virgibacillus dokdonensis TaxID=302167 RepID=A0ABU7VBQ4_9BACI|nr:ferritin family protein [Virgibacillus sp.]NWO14105.1 DUF2202 domain-containing protein [Virgibacillus sp.]
MQPNYDNYHLPAQYNRPANQTHLMNQIQTAIHAEYSAIACYEKLASLAPTSFAKQQILEIQQDEKRHLETFTHIYTRLTHKQPTYQITESCPDNYDAGIAFAFKDEQGAVDFYLDIADQAEDQYIKERFRRAAADEQNHAVWFLYLLHSTSKKPPSCYRQNENYGAKGALNDPNLTLISMLTYALQDEYLAQARYNTILETFGYIRTFAQIQEAEKRHIEALLTLFDRYQVAIPEDASAKFVTTPNNIKAAYAQGVEGEIDNISMYEKFLTYTIPADMQTVFSQLRNASLNHLQAFENGLARHS